MITISILSNIDNIIISHVYAECYQRKPTILEEFYCNTVQGTICFGILLIRFLTPNSQYHWDNIIVQVPRVLFCLNLLTA